MTTLALLRELRTRGNCGAWKVLQHAELLFLDLPEPVDEGDSGILSTSMKGAWVSAEFLAKSSRMLETQHLLRGLAREKTGAAGRWLRDKGFEEDRVDWSQFSDPRSPAETPPDLSGQRMVHIFGTITYLAMGMDDLLGPFFSLMGLLFLTQTVDLFSRVRGWKFDPERCARCRTEPEIPAMLDSESGLCRVCERKVLSIPGRNYLLLLLFLTLTSAFYMQLYQPIGLVLANLGLSILLTGVATFVHELGHLLAGVIAGYRVVSLHLGSGDLRKGFKLGPIWIYLQAQPVGGMVMSLAPRTRARRWRSVLYSLAGPGANLFMAWLMWKSLDGLPGLNLSQAWCQGLQPALTFFYVNLAMAINNLWPRYSVAGSHGQLPSDGRAALDALRAGKQASPKLLETLTLLQAGIYRDFGNHEAELLFLDEAVLEPDRAQKLHRMFLLGELERWEEALAILPELLEPDVTMTPEQRSVELNMLAWSQYMSGDLEQADRLSAECLELFSELSNNLGTRAEVLAARGHLAEARPMLEKAIQVSLCHRSTAHNCKALARLAALQGDLGEFERLSLLGRKLDPEKAAYASAQDAVEDARGRGHWVPKAGVGPP